MIKIQRLKNNNALTYYSFTFIEFKYIDTTVVKSVNIVLFNILFKFDKFKEF